MDNFTPLKRPKPGDDEEELIRMQQEFLSNKQEPSAKVVNLRGQPNNQFNIACKRNEPNTGKIRSRFSEQKRLKTQNRISTSSTSGDVINPAIRDKVPSNLNEDTKNSNEDGSLMPSNIILGNIMEKNHSADKYEFKLNPKTMDSLDTGFPPVFVSDYTGSKSESRQSIFMQNISKKKELAGKAAGAQATTNVPIFKDEDGSTIIQGTWADEIHKANIEKMRQMTEEDILKEKQRLEATLNPDVIRFLRNRKEKKNKVVEETAKQENNKKHDNALELMDSNNEDTTEPMHSNDKNRAEKMDLNKDTTEPEESNNKRTTESMDSNNEATDTPQKDESDYKKSESIDVSASMEYENVGEDIPEPSAELLTEAKEKGWVHMDAIEPVKLKWMTDIADNKIAEPPVNEPYNARFNFDGVLLPFKDDNLTVDKGLHHHGEEPQRPGYSLQELLQLSRSATQQQRCTALNTLANIMEKSRKGWYDKTLYPAPLVALSQKNIILLLRFSLDDSSRAIVTASLQALRSFLYSEADEVCLDRLWGWDNYIEPPLMPPPNDVTDTSSLKDHELAQLDAVSTLLRSDIILRLRYVLSEVQPPPIGVTCALEILIRLARRSHIDALNIASTPHLLDTIVKHFMPLSTDKLAMGDAIHNVYGVPVITAVRLCRILVCYGGRPVAERLNNLKIVQPILSYISSDAGKDGIHLTIESLRLWKILLHHNVAMESLDGAQLTLISQLQLLLSNFDMGNSSELACEHAANLITVASCKELLHSNITVLLQKWSVQFASITSPSWGAMKLLAQTLLAVNDTSSFNTKWILNSRLYSLLCSTSNLLSDLTFAEEREPSCLPNFGVLTQNGSLQSIVSQQSCIPFLAKVLHFFCDHFCHEEIKTILNDPSVYNYLRRLESTKWSLERSWYTRTELSLLTAIAKGAAALKSKLDPQIADTVWKITINLISTLPADAFYNVKQLLKIALSNEDLKLQLVINKLTKLHLENDNEEINIEIKHDVASLYQRYISSSGNWNEAAMPKDWLYLPVVHIYTHCKNNGTCNDEHKSCILIVLSLELGLPDLFKQLSPTLRFSRLLLIYLCDTLYLCKDVALLLKRAISRLLYNHFKELDLASDLPGLNSFTDLFTAICEHFCSTSYGDDNFGTILLVPIAQRHDAHYRKLLWSEHAGALRYLRLSFDKLIIPLSEYLYPEEDDTSLIESYLTALVRGTVKQEWCPIPYAIAVHHSAMYLKRTSKLAIRMRTQIEKIPNRSLADALLCYEPPKL